MEDNKDTKNNRIECKECGSYYKNEKSLKTHINKMHNNIKVHNCSYCLKDFTNNFNYLSFYIFI